MQHCQYNSLYNSDALVLLTVSTLFIAENAFLTQEVEFRQTKATLASTLCMVQEGPAEFRYL